MVFKVHKVLLVFKVLKGSKVLKVLLESKVLKGSKVLKD